MNHEWVSCVVRLISRPRPPIHHHSRIADAASLALANAHWSMMEANQTNPLLDVALASNISDPRTASPQSPQHHLHLQRFKT